MNAVTIRSVMVLLLTGLVMSSCVETTGGGSSRANNCGINWIFFKSR